MRRARCIGAVMALTIAGCGASGSDADVDGSVGGAGTATETDVVAQASHPILALAADDTALYWLQHEPETELFELYRQALTADAAPELLAAETYEEPQWGLSTDIELDRGEVFWRWPGTGMLRSIPVDGGSVLSLADAEKMGQFTVDLNQVYWTDGQQAWSAPRTGGDPSELGSLGFATGIVADDYAVYVIERLDAFIVRFPVDGSEGLGWASWVGDNTMTLDQGPEHLVWSSNSSRTLLAAKKTTTASAGEVFAVADEAATMAGEVVVGADEVFVAPGFWDFDHVVRRWPLAPVDDATEATIVADPGEECAAHLALVDETLYWSDCSGGVHVYPAD